MNKKTITEERISKSYSVGGKPFTPEIILRDGKFSRFTAHIETGFKVKYDLILDAEDVEVFNHLKDFFKSLD